MASWRRKHTRAAGQRWKATNMVIATERLKASLAGSPDTFPVERSIHKAAQAEVTAQLYAVTCSGTVMLFLATMLGILLTL